MRQDRARGDRRLTEQFGYDLAWVALRVRRRRATAKVSQSRTVESPEPETSVWPSGLNASENTYQECPGNRTSSSPVATSQTRMLRSCPPEAIRVPSGWKTADRTSRPWPTKV